MSPRSVTSVKKPGAKAVCMKHNKLHKRKKQLSKHRTSESTEEQENRIKALGCATQNLKDRGHGF